MDSSELLEGLKALGNESRLRIVVVLRRNELTVTQICDILEQSQPRVSRDLRILCEAGLLERHNEGTSAFFRRPRSGTARGLSDTVLSLLDLESDVIAEDTTRLALVRAACADEANAYFEAIAPEWDQIRALHVQDSLIEQAMLQAVEGMAINDMLDIGTGTGRILEVFGKRIQRGLGIDISRQMLSIARNRLEGPGWENCAVRIGDAYDPGVGSAAFDVTVLHHVLHFLDDPTAAVEAAAKTLRPGGKLLIVDFSPHTVEALRTEHHHHRLGFADEEMAAWCRSAGLADPDITHLVARTTPDIAERPLTITLWVADRKDAP